MEEIKEISPEMEEPAEDEDKLPSTARMPEVEKIVRSLGLIFNNTFLYGADHSVTKKAVEDSFSLFNRALESCQEITFSISDDGIVVNGETVEQKNPLIRMFVTRIAGLEINSFSLTRGITQEKFEKFIEIMNRKPEELKQSGGFSAVVSESRLENVRIRKVTYQQVAEEEVIVSKEKLEKADVGGAAGVESILSFLKGEVPEDSEKALKSVQKIASDAEKLPELIMRAAEAGKERADLEGGEPVAGLIVDALRRTYEGLIKDPSIKTQKGKKKLGKVLTLLEKEIPKKMREISDGIDSEAENAVSDTIEEMQDELKIDALAAEYMKKRNAIENSEKRILRFIKTKGLEKIDGTELQEKLTESGLASEGWHELLVKSGVGEVTGIGIGEGGEGISAVGHLAGLLAQMQKKIEREGQAEVPPEELKGVLIDVNKEVTNLVGKTEKKILNLVENIRAEEEEAVGGKKKKGGKPPTLSRKRLLEILAEIVQELCQPLAVIKCSIDAICARSLGNVTGQQEEMLKLASSSGDRLKKLIDKLVDIAGVPKTREPDAEIISSLY